MLLEEYKPGMGAKESIVIYGAGGHARVVLDTVVAQGHYIVTAIIDPGKADTVLHSLTVCENELSLEPTNFIVALGNNQLRKQIFFQLKSSGWTPAVVLHPTSVISPSASFGAGTVLFARAVVNANSRVGENCIINTGATIDHDCLVGDHAHVAPGCNLAGGVTLGEGALASIGSAVIQEVTLGAWSRLGAGGVATEDVPANATWVGVPARLATSSLGNAAR
jgi:sugar O-acyltransferase (sialic acid O-acetyltransferase NeuD family)